MTNFVKLPSGTYINLDNVSAVLPRLNANKESILKLVVSGGEITLHDEDVTAMRTILEVVRVSFAEV